MSFSFFVVVQNDCVGMLVCLSLSFLLFIAVSTGEGKNLSITENKLKLKQFGSRDVLFLLLFCLVCFVFSRC